MIEDDDLLLSLYKEAEEDSSSVWMAERHVLDGKRYTDYRKIGEGGLKVVYAVKDNHADREVALAKPKDGVKAKLYDSILREAWLTSGLDHANIISVFDVGITEDDKPYFTMELKTGQTLAEAKIKSESEAIDLISKVVDAIAHAHHENVLHLDLKPQNIQVNQDYGEVKVCDWGLGANIHTEGHTLLDEGELDTLHGMIRGTPGFMAPEQTEPGANLDERTDIFGLGALMVFCLSGKAPVDQGNTVTMIEKTQTGQWTIPALPSSLEAICRKALHLDPEKRYQSVGDLKKDILLYKQSYPTLAEKATVMRRVYLSYQRHQFLTHSLSSLIFILLIGWAYFHNNIKERELRAAYQAEQLEKAQQVAELEKQLSLQAQEKANMALIKVDDLTNSIKQHLSNNKVEAAERSNDIGKLADHIKTSMIFNQPERVIEAVEEVCHLGLKLDPKHEHCWHHLIEMRMITLDIEKAKEFCDQTTQELRVQKHMNQFIQNAPKVSFNENDRPSIEELTNFIEYFIDPKTYYRPAYLERIIHYDASTRENREGYESVIMAYMKVINRDVPSFKISYRSPQRTLSVDGQGYELGVNFPIVGSGYSLFRFMPISHFYLKGQPNWEKTKFNGVRVIILDVRGLDHVPPQVFDQFEKVSKITIRENQFDSDQIELLSESYNLQYK